MYQALGQDLGMSKITRQSLCPHGQSASIHFMSSFAQPILTASLPYSGTIESAKEMIRKRHRVLDLVSASV